MQKVPCSFHTLHQKLLQADLHGRRTLFCESTCGNAPQSMHFRPGHILVATMICTQETANAARPPKAVRKFHRMVPDQANRCCQVCTFCEKHGCCLGASQGRPNSVTCSWGRHICSTCYADHLFRRPQPASGSDEENGDVEGTHYRNSVENGAH